MLIIIMIYLFSCARLNDRKRSGLLQRKKFSELNSTDSLTAACWSLAMAPHSKTWVKLGHKQLWLARFISGSVSHAVGAGV